MARRVIRKEDDIDLPDLSDHTCSIEHASCVIAMHARAIRTSPRLAHNLPPLMLWGAPGVGKSTIVRDIAKEQGLGFIDIRLSQREPVDIRGLPVPDKESVKWLISSDWPRDPESRGIILFDEITAADRTLQVAAYEIILDRRLGSLYSLPDGWLIIAAGNRTEDRAVAGTMSSALANRFCHLEIAPNLEDWCRWAICQELHPDVIGFLRFRPEYFISMKGDLEKGWPSPRSWERVSHELFLLEQEDVIDPIERLLLTGLVGTAAAHEFCTYRKWSGELQPVLPMMTGEENIVIPERADQRYALCGAMVYHLWHERNTQELMEGFFKIALKLSADFSAMVMIDALTGKDGKETSRRSKVIMTHPYFSQWMAVHGEGLQLNQFKKSTQQKTRCEVISQKDVDILVNASCTSMETR